MKQNLVRTPDGYEILRFQVTKEQKLFFAACILLLACFLGSLMVGRYPLTSGSICELVWLKLLHLEVPSHFTSDAVVFWLVRLPRAVMALIVGAVLAVSGTVFQGLFRNPLVSPDILGVSAGAGFGAGLAILLFGDSVLAIQGLAFLSGLLAVTLAYQIGKHCRGDAVTVLVLAGVIVSALFTAGLSFLKYVADPFEKLPAIVFWTMGGFSNIVWEDVWHVLPVAVLGMAVLFLLRWKLDILALGDEEALSLGINVSRLRVAYIFSTTLIVASSVAVCGTIGWVGLVVPHMARLLIGPSHNQLVGFAAIIGAVFMLAMDTLARSLTGGKFPSVLSPRLLGPLTWPTFCGGRGKSEN